MKGDALEPADEKRRAREHWTADPCGAVYGSAHEIGTRAFFSAVARHRYTEYAPWMPAVMGFDEFAGARLLEVGCGIGTDLLQFARAGARVTAVDLTPRSIEITRRHLALHGQRGHLAIADCERLPFADGSFDVVYCHGVLHHTPDTAGAVREIHRVLRAGGQARVMLYHRHSLVYWGQIVLRHGLLRGEFLRGRSTGDIMRRYVEFNAGGGRPLVKVYSRREARHLFSMFREVRTEVEQLTRRQLPVVGRLIPDTMFRRVQRSVGWNVIVTARK